MPFNALDVALIALLVAGGVGGFRLGLIARAASWLGMAAGVAIAARFLPGVVRSAEGSTGRAELILIAIGLLLAGAVVGQALGIVAGSRLHVRLRSGVARRFDSVGGAVAGTVGVLVAIWLIVPAVADVPGSAARAVRGSRVARAVTEVFPEAPDGTRTLRRLLGEDYPQVFDALKPTPGAGVPPVASGLSDAVTLTTVQSVVKVVGEACGRIQEGSGFVAATGIVVTNAHVVGGESTTRLERSDGSRVAATVVVFDPARDLAVLAAPGIDRPALRLGTAARGDKGAVFGHPGGGALELSPYLVDQQIDAVGTDIYGTARTERDVLVLASALAPGDSGSALVDPAGLVVGVAFAIAPDRPGVAYALTTAEVRPVLAKAASSTRQAVDTGPCLD